MRVHFLLFTILIGIAGVLRGTEPAEAFRGWSGFEKVDVEKLARGKIATVCNGGMSFTRGMSAQAVFVVKATPEVAVRTLLTSDPTKHPDEGTYQRPLFHNETEAGFAKIRLDPKIASVRRLLEVMRKREELHLSREETDRLPKGNGVEEAQRFWAETMRLRWTQWTQRGELRATESIDVRGEIGTLLKEEPKVARHFAELLTPFTATGAPAVPTVHYWDLSNVNHTAAISLGVIYTRVVDGRQQVLDVSYYASSGYLTSVTLYELVPIMIGGEPQTLVWVGCMVSAPALAGGFGVKKAIGSRLMVGDLEKSIRFFQTDAAGTGK